MSLAAALSTDPAHHSPLELMGSLAQAQQCATRGAGSAQRLLTSYSHDLEPAIYECPAVLKAVKRLVLGRRFAKVRVLIADPGRIHYENSAFIALARKLTSYIEIRQARGEYGQDPSAYMVADDHAFWCRPNQSRWEGLSQQNALLPARVFLDRFDLAWMNCGQPRR